MIGGSVFAKSDNANTFTNCYETVAGPKPVTLVSDTNTSKGENALTAMPLVDKFGTTDSYPALIIFGGTASGGSGEGGGNEGGGNEGGTNGTPGSVWNGATFAPVDSNTDGIIEINTAEELAFVVQKGGGASYILTADIYLNNVNDIDWATGAANDGKTANQWFTSDAGAAADRKATAQIGRAHV